MAEVRLYPVQRIVEDNGSITVFEGGFLPFDVKRVFVVEAPLGETRGNHAHRTCQQFIWVISGRVAVEVDDGRSKSRYELEANKNGLFIPPMTWACQTYLAFSSKILVACDQTFWEDDYIRDYQSFLSLIEKG